MNLEELVVKLLGVLDAGIAISPDGEIHDDIRDALREEKAEARCTHGIRRPHECKACADEPSKEEIAAITGERDALRSALNPRGWTRAQSDAWHRALPDTERAFRALHEASVAAGGEG